MSTDKFRYTIYPEYMYVVALTDGVKIEIRGAEVLEAVAKFVERKEK